MGWTEQQTPVALNAVHFMMGATGVYHEALAYTLYRAGAKVSVVDPAQGRDDAKGLGSRTRTDKKDKLGTGPLGCDTRDAVMAA